LFGPPFFAFTLDSHNLKTIEASSNTFDYDRTINVPNYMPIQLKLPFPAAMNSKNDPARLPAQDALHRVKCA
jgi:hypothetical protein